MLRLKRGDLAESMPFKRDYWAVPTGLQEGQRGGAATLGKGLAGVLLVRAVVRCAEADAEDPEAEHEDSEPRRRSPQGGIRARD